MCRYASNLLQTEETSMKGIDLNIPRRGMVLSEAKINFFLSKLYEENLIGTEDYVIAKKILNEKRVSAK